MAKKLHWCPQTAYDQWWGLERPWGGKDDTQPVIYRLQASYHVAPGGKIVPDWEVTIDDVVIRCTSPVALMWICRKHYEKGELPK